LEQNYEYDLVNQAKLLERYIGMRVEFIRLDEETKKERIISGTLLSPGLPGAKNGMVAEIGGKIELNPAGRLVLPSLPDGLILHLSWSGWWITQKPGTHKVELSYLAGQLSWEANYVALLLINQILGSTSRAGDADKQFGYFISRCGLEACRGEVNMVRNRFNRGY